MLEEENVHLRDMSSQLSLDDDISSISSAKTSEWREKCMAAESLLEEADKTLEEEMMKMGEEKKIMGEQYSHFMVQRDEAYNQLRETRKSLLEVEFERDTLKDENQRLISEHDLQVGEMRSRIFSLERARDRMQEKWKAAELEVVRMQEKASNEKEKDSVIIQQQRQRIVDMESQSRIDSEAERRKGEGAAIKEIQRLRMQIQEQAAQSEAKADEASEAKLRFNAISEEKRVLEGELRREKEKRGLDASTFEERLRHMSEQSHAKLKEKDTIIEQLTQDLNEMNRKMREMRQELADSEEKKNKLQSQYSEIVGKWKREEESLQEKTQKLSVWKDELEQRDQYLKDAHRRFEALRGATFEEKESSDQRVMMLESEIEKIEMERHSERRDRERRLEEIQQEYRRAMLDDVDRSQTLTMLQEKLSRIEIEKVQLETEFADRVREMSYALNQKDIDHKEEVLRIRDGYETKLIELNRKMRNLLQEHQSDS
eukprot:TRINITY_DN2252_c0_g1_i2.p1 TRINITY_DN2252_c0_g1~~TRINITY_DN2252_c0_g1_i2.p1  ORF type:complete len:486 (-),score=184.35 TRINITY_DN2252_c0_g1_i2:1633-3090(-)